MCDEFQVIFIFFIFFLELDAKLITISYSGQRNLKIIFKKYNQIFINNPQHNNVTKYLYDDFQVILLLFYFFNN